MTCTVPETDEKGAGRWESEEKIHVCTLVRFLVCSTYGAHFETCLQPVIVGFWTFLFDFGMALIIIGISL